ncbi:MAG: hypothetical protein QF638_09280 [Acidimicrobiales bacterium]|nr:hypothetical protein [Acidimicrobiales bacterium]
MQPIVRLDPPLHTIARQAQKHTTVRFAIDIAREQKNGGRRNMLP